MQMRPTRENCFLATCQWCGRDDLPCRFCAGSGWWRPERPHRDSVGAIDWVRVEEPCRMCAATGKEHNPLAAPAVSGH
ncbi:hypothetical protein CLV63_11131 [Murinocardiopsis flavida]|uniref:Uncharacterized protein n=1 Tax=Murinocardiopsis flavida TaxID=645275 RepID=A0A2P8DGU3_9ACTN|nr:hypothetical protein CLV63_11131 [Murinocardiopsis flavida]